MDDNLGRAVSAIEAVARAECDVVVLPECLDRGWTFPGARELAHPIAWPASDRLRDTAASAGVVVVAGLTERDGDRIYNSAVLIGQDGALLAKHRKINEMDFVREFHSAGTSLQVVATPLGVIGIDICADNAYPTLALGRALAARMGCP